MRTPGTDASALAQAVRQSAATTVRVDPVRRLEGTERRLQHPRAADPEQNTMYYGLGWDGSGGTAGSVPVTSFVNPQPQQWNTTPCVTLLGHAVCSGRSFGGGFQNLAQGMTGVSAIAGGIADQGVENWIWAPYTAPPAGGTSGGGTWVTQVTLTAHVDTVLLANNIGALSDVGTDILDMNADLPYLGQDTRTLGVGTYVDIDASFLSGSEASQVAEDITNENLPAMMAILQSVLQSTVDSALGTLAAPPTTSAEQASDFLNALMGAVAGANYDQSTFTQTFTMPAGQSVLIGFSPELMVANAGVGVTGAMAVSFVQLQVSGTTEREGTATTLQVTPQHSNGVRYNYGSTSWYLPIVLKTADGKPLAGQTVTVTFPGSDGTRQTWTCTTDNSGSCLEALGPLAIQPGPQVPLTVSFAGTSQYLASSATTDISENPGPTTLQLGISSPSETSEGLPVGSTAILSATLAPQLPGAAWGGAAPLGEVEFLANGSPVGECQLQDERSGATCDAVWEPSLMGSGSTPATPVSLEAVWSGNMDWFGAESAVQRTTVYVPGVSLSLTARPTELGEATVCLPGEPDTCHVLSYGDQTTIEASVFDNGQPTRGGYTVHLAIGGATAGSCQTTGTSCTWTYQVAPPPTQTTTYTVEAWVTGPGSQTHPGVNAEAAFTYDVPSWPLAVRSLGAPMLLSQAPVALGAAGPGELWVWVAPTPRAAPDALWLVDTGSRSVVARTPLPAGAEAFGVGPDGGAWTVTASPRPGGWEQLVGRWPDGRAVQVPLPMGFAAEALASASARAVWVVGTEAGQVPRVRGPVGAAPPLVALLLEVPAGIVTASAVLPGSAGASTDPWAVAADGRGLWVATRPGATVDWVTPSGATPFHLAGAAEPGTEAGGASLQSLGLNEAGEGWIAGYGAAGAAAAWPIAGDGTVIPSPVVFGPTVNMVSQGVAVNALGVGYLAFSSIGGGHGLPGIAAVAPDLSTGLTLLPLGTLPGGGVGAAVWMPDGTLWAAVPFSHALFELVSEAPP